MPTYKRYVLRDGDTVLFFTKKPNKIYDRAWLDLYNHSHPNCYLQEKEAEFNFNDLPPNQVIEVQIKVNLKRNDTPRDTEV